MTPFPTWPALLIACHANHLAGPRGMTEYATMRDQLNQLRLATARIVGPLGWPAVEFDGYRVGAGLGAWTDFMMADYVLTHSPLLLALAALAAEGKGRR